MKSKPRPSPVMQLLKIVWDATPRGSWSRLNGAMQGAMNLAIGAGFAFEGDDFKHALNEFNGDYWFSSEGFYAHACRTNNLTAARSFEAWQKRPPFIVDGAYDRKRGRVAAGAHFMWRGELVKVTSMSGEHLVACSYRNDKVLHLYTISVADIRAERQERRERKRLLSRLPNAGGGGLSPDHKRRMKCYGIVTQADWDAAPVAVLRDLVDALEAKKARS